MVDPKHAFRAGLVVIGGMAIAVAFFVVTRKSQLDDSNSAPYYALLTDSSGINSKSLITIAGLQVGEIVDINLTTVTLKEFAGHERDELEQQYAEVTADGLSDAKRRLLKTRYKSAHARWVERYGATDDEIAAWEEPVSDEQEREGLVYGGKPPPLPAWNPKTIIPVARVEMRIIRDIKVPTDTWLKKESLGLLGAKALFMDLGEREQSVPPGGRIKNVRSVTGLDALQQRAETIVASVESIVRTIDRDLGGIVGDVRGVTHELNRFIAGDEENPPLDEIYALVMNEVRKAASTIEKAVRGVDGMLRENDKAVGGLIANMERISADIADLTSDGSDGGPGTGGELRETIVQVHKIADDLADITTTLKDVIGENEDEVDQGVKELKNTLSELNRSLTSLAEVTGRIERGEGTVGRLLTDERMADKVESAVAGASDYVTSLTSIEAHVDLGTWYRVRENQSAVSFELRIQPSPDKYYLIGVVDDGGGIERFTSSFGGGGGAAGDPTTQRTSIREDDNTVRITAMFAKKFWDFLVLRAGLLETSGALGANLLFWDDRIELRSDLFNLGAPRHALNDVVGDDPVLANLPLYLPRWRTMLKVQPIPHLYVVAGIDDALNFQVDPAVAGYGFDYFFGAGLTFKDDDLRSILPFVPSF
jgi:phospholipid/cholesterol/gamma-HCH transport system substrate-binding protein